MRSTQETGGPLAGIRVIEVQAMGPAPFAAMVLSDLGADVLRIDRIPMDGAIAADGPGIADVLSRGRRSICVDLKTPDGAALLLNMVESADVLIEGFRPGVMERLGVGPHDCRGRNDALIYARVTGWGREGPLAHAAGHDINYLSLSGTLWPIGRSGEAPVPPLTYVGDFGGGGMLLAMGICAALVERATSGSGQVVDAAMVDGSALLNAFMYGMRAMGTWGDDRGDNLLDGGAPFYDTYETADGRWVSVGALEPHFYRNLLTMLGIDDVDPAAQMDRDQWESLRKRLAECFRSRTRDEWAHLGDDAEACVAPVLSPWEAPAHPHNADRETFVEVGGVVQPAPAPRFSRTTVTVAGPPPLPGEHTDELLEEHGVSAAQAKRLRRDGVIA